MSPWYRFRMWRHRNGHHLFCREVRVVDHIETGREFLAIKKADGTLEFDDMSVFGGRPVYKTVHG